MQLKQITSEQVKSKNLKKIGQCFSVNLGHAVYMMQKYSKNADKAKYYTIKFQVEDENNMIKLATNQSKMMIVEFWQQRNQGI